MTTFVVADDHRLILHGLRSLLEAENDWKVVGEATDGRAAVDLIERLQPDVAIVDVVMPELNGLEVVRQVKQVAPETRVVMISIHPDEPYVLEALREGAQAYVLKGMNMAVLVEAVHRVLEGQRYLSPPLSNSTIDAFLQRASDAGRPIDAYDLLTFRERQVLELAAREQSSQEIGKQLGISPRTVETHRANLMRKLGLSSQGDLVRFARQRGIIHDA